MRPALVRSEFDLKFSTSEIQVPVSDINSMQSTSTEHASRNSRKIQQLVVFWVVKNYPAQGVFVDFVTKISNLYT